MLTAEALIVLYVFGNATSYLLADHASETPIEVGAVEEILTDNAPLALNGALWELDQELATFVTSEDKLVPTVLAFVEQLMEKVALRAQTANHLGPFTSANYRVEEDDLTISGFTPSRAHRARS